MKNTKEIVIALKINDKDSNLLTEVLFDIDTLLVDGNLLHLVISGKVQDIEKYSETARSVEIKKKKFYKN